MGENGTGLGSRAILAFLHLMTWIRLARVAPVFYIRPE